MQGEKKILKIKKPKDVSHFLVHLKILISAHARVPMC